ncbi:tetraspanin-12 [Athalia rosae]|uniref:tetraspanin-12 n=1 Tax=Athalia rosae TaxID=37344 RepID=UPI0020332A6C|nr:tetraspanin-12 [Athalia rosae]
MAGLQLSASSRCVKYLMFIFNLIFVITGILLISIGSVILGVYHDYEHFLDNKFFSVPALLIAVGTIIFFIAFFGCCGAVRENYCMIVTFSTLMVLVFILELAGGISGYVLRSHATHVVADKMHESMARYSESKEIALVWNNLQEHFQCCGTHNITDWQPYFANDTLPQSCCNKETGFPGNETCRIDSPNVQHQDCFTRLLMVINGHAVQLGGVGIGVAFVQLTGVMIMSIATTIYAVYEDFSHFLDPTYFSPATLLMVVGVLIFIIAFLGCCGAIKESTCMVLVFAVLMSLVLTLEISAAIAALFLQCGIKNVLSGLIETNMHQYKQNVEASLAINFLQSKLHCCGYDSYKDWDAVPSINENDSGVPNSCCSWYTEFHNSTMCASVYESGCINRLDIVISRSALYLGTGATAIALIQLTGIMFACMLGRSIRRQKTERERRRWELRESLVNGYQQIGRSDPVATFPVVYMQSPDYPLNHPVSSDA